ncbi:hypothetical protein RchiOBHm_Chr7g0208601 [Rosa chinensis]|uniref:Rapid ALkalinization Factor n=1 Tax=Rosa chinensis TaxID=74649 RepID=A0A2P6P9Q9_ROSCH|nr:hypothetical protein RchiOBHm_Chr7g0208601 [Rosa chinensis]
MSGYSSSAAVLLAMMMVMMTMFITKTDCFSINQTITVSSTWCDGLNDDLSCLIGQTDLDSDEFMLDSEFSRRILGGGGISFTAGTGNAGHAVSCTRGNPPKPCHPEGNSNPPPPQCAVAGTNRDCYRYKK